MAVVGLAGTWNRSLYDCYKSRGDGGIIEMADVESRVLIVKHTGIAESMSSSLPQSTSLQLNFESCLGKLD